MDYQLSDRMPPQKTECHGDKGNSLVKFSHLQTFFDCNSCSIRQNQIPIVCKTSHLKHHIENNKNSQQISMILSMFTNTLYTKRIQLCYLFSFTVNSTVFCYIAGTQLRRLPIDQTAMLLTNVSRQQNKISQV